MDILVKPKIAAIYTRYSSHEQDGGESIEFQTRRCKEYIKNQGWKFSEENLFIDKARSGTMVAGRDSFNKMIELATGKERSFDYIVSFHTSRFGRNIEEAFYNKLILRNNGVEVKFVSQSIPEDHTGKLLERVFEWMDEAQSIFTGKMIFEGLKQTTMQGFSGGGTPPYGYKTKKIDEPSGKRNKRGNIVKKVVFEIDKSKARVVREIFESYANRMSYKSICKDLNSRGILSPTLRLWDNTAVMYILNNEAYLGWRVWNKMKKVKQPNGKRTYRPNPRSEWIIVKNAHLPIINKKIWKKVQERKEKVRKLYSSKKPSYGKTRSLYPLHLLSGIMKCGICGHNYVTTSRINEYRKCYNYYGCSWYNRRGNIACTNNYVVPAKPIENKVINLIEDTVVTHEMITSITELVNKELSNISNVEESDIEFYNNEIRKLESAIKNLIELAKTGVTEEVIDEIKRCEERKKEIILKRDEMLEMKKWKPITIDYKSVENEISNFKSLFKSGTFQEQRQIIEDNIESITVNQDKKMSLKINPQGPLSFLDSDLLHYSCRRWDSNPHPE